MLRNTDDARDLQVTVMSLAVEAASLEAHIRRLREEIATVDTRLDALHESLRSLPAPGTPPVEPGDGMKSVTTSAVG
ncbi:hypothetical protein [Streptomyces sp. NPDC026673]|uniref:hypothetical protein n=1 Tax=Streptomyces sp. NPDC026673 TaxID=3155724 RepID=UPI0034111C56